jgi:hypothetical protein
LIGLALGAIITPHGMEDRSRGLVPCFHLLTATGDGERIVPTAIIERFCMRADGELGPMTSDSTRPITQVTTHAGIVATTVYQLREPTVPPDPAMRIAP